MRIDIATLFVDMCKSVLSESIVGRAQASGKVEINCHCLRDFSQTNYKSVDDYLYGGGKGMLMQPQPLFDCYKAVEAELGKKPHVIYMSPQGKVLTQKTAVDLSKKENIFILCGHYEGVDQRLLDEIVDEEISIGDYVLTGGELAAMVLVDSVVRLLDGVLSGSECFENESHYSGLLECPQYTRPPVWRGREVPEILLSGHHAKIEEWRRQKSLETTLRKRPDLLENAELNEKDRKFLDSLKLEKTQEC